MLSQSPITVSVETLQTILNAIPNPVFLKDRQHRLTVVNDALCDLMGLSRNQIINRADDSVPDAQREVFWKVDDDVFATGTATENEEVLTDGAGIPHVIVTRKRLIRLPTPDGEQPFIIAVISDVTRFREAEARAKYLSEHDPLTGLANRAQLNDRLASAIETATRTGSRLAFVLIDIDGFKPVNDHHGHPAGDELLRVLSRRLAGLVRSVDTVARFGGDEFCIVQEATDQPAAAFGLAERAMTSISRPIVIGLSRVSVSASIGMAVFPDDGATPEQLLHTADAALYAVKRTGRPGYIRYEGDAGRAPLRGWDVEGELRAALSGHQVTLAFQPLAAAADGEVRGFEALARWRHPTHGDISPEMFIPVAEATGLIQELGSWILHQACAAAAAWPWKLVVAVNISPSQLETGDLPKTVANALLSSGLDPSRLELEVTETALLGGSERVSEIFSRLKGLGVSLALDDFGAGWSSLSTLRTFRFDRIKIDRSFIANIVSDARSVAIVRAVLSLGRSLNVPITAEGVEEQGQFIALRQLGCAELQGFYLGRPGAEATLPDLQVWRRLLGPEVIAPAAGRGDLFRGLLTGG